MKTINIVGWYGRNNCGDEAFKDAFELLLPGEKVFSERPQPAHVRILGGGDVIKSHYLDRIEDEFFIMGAGLGYASEISLLRGKRVRKAFFRNKGDVSIAQLNGINAAYIPDLVFSLPPPKRTRPAGERKRAVVLLNGAIAQKYSTIEKRAENAYADYFKWELASALSYLSEWYDFTFLPFSAERYNQDIMICHDVVHRMEKPYTTFIMSQPLAPMAALQELANADLVLSMKFHGLIFATIAGVPFVSIGWSRKMQLFCQDHGLNGMCIDPFTFTQQKLLSAVTYAERYDVQNLTELAMLKRAEVRSTVEKFKAEFDI